MNEAAAFLLLPEPCGHVFAALPAHPGTDLLQSDAAVLCLHGSRAAVMPGERPGNYSTTPVIRDPYFHGRAGVIFLKFSVFHAMQYVDGPQVRATTRRAGNEVMKDRALIQQIEALEEVITWLEQREASDLPRASATTAVDADEVDEWLRSPELEKVREWLKK